jgi:O-succinylbenzoate synthase
VPTDVPLAGVELRLLRLPLAEPFGAAHATRLARPIVLVRALVAEGPDGWGECVAEAEPSYWPEYSDGAWHVLEHHLVPRLLGGRSLEEVRGHQMAKAALRCAVIDAGLRAEGRSMAAFLGAVRAQVATGIALGITPSLDDLVAAAERWHGEGHRSFKLKVRPGWDVEPVAAVRKALGEAVALLVDANGAFRSDDPDDVAGLERLAEPDLGLAAIEQPFPPDDLVGHARLAERLAASPTAVCLDESIGSLGDLETALALGACDAVSLKAGRVGGPVEAGRIHHRCVDEAIAVRCGGMLETGVGRALNLAIAALPGCTLPPDLGPSHRYFAEDVTVPFDASSGNMKVPQGPGLGVEPRADMIDRTTERSLLIQAPR